MAVAARMTAAAREALAAARTFLPATCGAAATATSAAAARLARFPAFRRNVRTHIEIGRAQKRHTTYKQTDFSIARSAVRINDMRVLYATVHTHPCHILFRMTTSNQYWHCTTTRVMYVTPGVTH